MGVSSSTSVVETGFMCQFIKSHFSDQLYEFTIIIPDSVTADKLIYRENFKYQLYNDRKYYSNKFGLKLIVIELGNVKDVIFLLSIFRNKNIILITPNRSRYGTTEELFNSIKKGIDKEFIFEMSYEDLNY
jgi:hypothetical protein